MPAVNYQCHLRLHHAYIGLGSNLENPMQNVQDAIVCLAQNPCIEILKRSSLYRTEPIETEGEYFINAVIAIQTCYQASDLLKELQAVEYIFGRERPYRYAPRTLDLDLLAYEGISLNSPELIIPHPRMHERAFVLHPFLEIAPEFQIPQLGALKKFLPLVDRQYIQKLSPYLQNCKVCRPAM
jgi:2-amino-4-hydroxy-6-hydroxymethyldihydropteridine diphosphokinase